MFDANLALRQLGFSTNRLHIMIGAKQFGKNETEKYVSFRFTAKSRNKANYCKISLDESDTYTMEFGYIRKFNYTVRSIDKGLYCDMLKNIFESETGLYLSI